MTTQEKLKELFEAALRDTTDYDRPPTRIRPIPPAQPAAPVLSTRDFLPRGPPVRTPGGFGPGTR